jgi:hypothetical protein
MSKLDEVKLDFDEYANDWGLSSKQIKWLIEQVEKQQLQIRELILAIYEHTNEGTELMELAEKIDETE